VDCVSLGAATLLRVLWDLLTALRQTTTILKVQHRENQARLLALYTGWSSTRRVNNPSLSSDPCCELHTAFSCSVMTPCSLGLWNTRFEGTHCLHLQSISDTPWTTNLAQGLVCSTYTYMLIRLNPSRLGCPFTVCICKYAIASGGSSSSNRGWMLAIFAVYFHF
jgi:hypothetical protein